MSFLTSVCLLVVVCLGVQLDAVQSLAAAPQTANSVLVPILAYHEIGPSAPNKYYVTPELFAQQMDVLAAYGYHPIDLEDLMDYREEGEALPEKPIIITFDDGLVGNYRYAYPILKARGFTATFFIIAGKIGATEDERQDNQSWNASGPLAYHMIWPEIQQMSADGFEIGSHSMFHSTLNGAFPNTAATEITQSRLLLQQHLPEDEIDFFVYPHGAGAEDPVIRDLVQQAGYRAALAYPDAGTAVDPLTADLLALSRISIYRDMGLKLDLRNPYAFFMRQVDPNYPYPNIGIYSTSFYDSWGSYRRTFYPGEAITTTVRLSNWNNAAPVRAAIRLQASNNVVYDSSQTFPSQNAFLNPLPSGNNSAGVSYRLTAPVITQTTPVSYTLTVSDQTGLINFFTLPITATGMQISPLPIRVEAAPLQSWLAPNQTIPITFTVTSLSSSAEQMFLTIDLSPGLAAKTSKPWTVYPAGTMIKLRTCSAPCIPSTYILAETGEAVFGAGVKTYVLSVYRLPGATGTEWISYRLTMRIPNSPIPYWYIRSPVNGYIDQQEYFADRLPLEMRYRVFLPQVR